MSDALTNTVTITLADVEREMKASFQVMRKIERRLGKPWAALGQMVAEGSYSIEAIATIIYEGLQGNNDPRMTEDQVGEEIVKQGFQAVLAPVIELITIGFKGTKQVAAGPKVEASPEA